MNLSSNKTSKNDFKSPEKLIQNNKTKIPAFLKNRMKTATNIQY